MAATGELAARMQPQSIAFSVNGKAVIVSNSPVTRLSRVLREDLGLTGTKVGCDAGDWGHVRSWSTENPFARA